MSMPNKVTRCLDLISHIQKIIMATLDLLFIFMCLKQAISPSSANMIKIEQVSVSLKYSLLGEFTDARYRIKGKSIG